LTLVCCNYIDCKNNQECICSKEEILIETCASFEPNKVMPFCFDKVDKEDI